MQIAVTGASGFIGSVLVQHLAERGISVVTPGREQIGEASMYAGCDAIIHCAGLAHRKATDQEHKAGNHGITTELASAARAVGVGRVVFVSTINTVAANAGPLRPDMPYAPLSDYGKWKAAAERFLLDTMPSQAVVIRPPLVCGAGARGNFGLLMRLCSSGLPLPFGSTNNRRSFVGVHSLASALHLLATAPADAVAGRIFHVSDGELSTRDIVEAAREAMGRPYRNISLPTSPFRLGLSLIGRSKMAEQLFGDLLVDGSALNRIGWKPAPLEPEIAAMASYTT